MNEDLSLDYDIGGLAVSASFLLDLTVFMILLTKVEHCTASYCICHILPVCSPSSL